MITYLLPTRNRHERLSATLRQLASLSFAAHDAVGGAEIIIVDDASDLPVRLPPRLTNAMPVTVLRRPRQEGASARNAAVRAARGEWVIMLDDDSWPVDGSVIEILPNVSDDVAAVGSQILLADGTREAGGLPEVFVGCGAAIRRHAFLDAGGYDAAFHYYVEEYDLCARLIMRGWRIIHDWRFVVRHEKVQDGRDMNRILHRLVRNNAWLTQRYAPSEVLADALRGIFDRYAGIAESQGAQEGFEQGRCDGLATLEAQPRTPMPMDQWDRFTGRAHVRRTLAGFENPRSRIAIIERGKNETVIESVLDELRWPIASSDDAEALIIGTLSPGPMMDAWERRLHDPRPVIRPWIPEQSSGIAHASENERRLTRMRRV